MHSRKVDNFDQLSTFEISETYLILLTPARFVKTVHLSFSTHQFTANSNPRAASVSGQALRSFRFFKTVHLYTDTPNPIRHLPLCEKLCATFGCSTAAFRPSSASDMHQANWVKRRPVRWGGKVSVREGDVMETGQT